LKLIAKFGKAFDVEKIKADLKPKIEQFIPGKFFDEYAVKFCNKVLEFVKDLLVSGDVIENVVKLVSGANFVAAVKYLKDAILGHVLSLDAPLASHESEDGYRRTRKCLTVQVAQGFCDS